MRFAPQAVGLAVLVAIATFPAPAPAQTDDPDRGDPSGVIYEIPLDNARRDAAPTGGGGGGGSNDGGSSGGGGSAPVTDATGGGTTSPIRSENGFGSSSQVPGATAAAGKKAQKGGENGKSGDRKTVPATIPPSESLGDPETASINPSPSKSRAYLLLGLALAVAAGIGVAGRYVVRRR